MGKESATAYFSQKTGILLWLLGVIGLCMAYAGWFGERRSVIFAAVGVALVILCAYEVVRGRLRGKKGTELDAVAREALPAAELDARAMKRLCIGGGDIKGVERMTLSGYSAFPIRTRPYFRRDAEDGRLRSSNYQSSMLIFCDDRFYSYSCVLSLVDKEKAESGRMWRYDQLVEAGRVSRELSYLVGTGDSKRETAVIEYLYLKDAEGTEYSFFFDLEPDGAEKAERALELLKVRMCAPEPAPADRDAAEPPEPEPEPIGEKSAARGRDLGVGEIGGKIKPPRR